MQIAGRHVQLRDYTYHSADIQGAYNPSCGCVWIKMNGYGTRLITAVYAHTCGKCNRYWTEQHVRLMKKRDTPILYS